MKHPHHNMRSKIIQELLTVSSVLFTTIIMVQYTSDGPNVGPKYPDNNITSGILYTQEERALTIAPIFKEIQYRVCSFNEQDHRRGMPTSSSDLKLIYFVTPTYNRPEQIAELTRLSHTLMHVPRIHWIVADDATACSEFVSHILQRSGLPYTHLLSPRPFINYRVKNRPTRGVANRRAAIKWIQENVHEGILFFGDDDNTYDLDLFDEIRKTKKLAMWPVGLVGTFGVSSPVLRNGKVIGFFDSWSLNREFPVDMAGFAIDLKYLTTNAKITFAPGKIETTFLLSLGFKLEDIEPLAKNCTQVLVWHTKTFGYPKRNLRVSLDKINSSSRIENTFPLIKELKEMHVVTVDPVNGATIGFVTCARNHNEPKNKKCLLTEKHFKENKCC